MVEPGTSGGVTLAGTVAALAGGLFIGLVGFILTQGAALLTLGAFLPGEWILLPVAAAGGLAGSFFDSYLGATVQAIYYCPRCSTETESEIHRCGQRTRQVRGWRWLNNDGVNFLATLFGAVVASLLGRLLM